VSFKPVEFTMPRPVLTMPDPAPRGDFLDLLLSAANGMFPAPVLEALIARLEAGK
jgi:hypothetical protein